MEANPSPPADPKFKAILDRLSACDRAQEPNESLAARAQIEANAVEDIRYLVTQLWNAHYLRNTAEWARRVIREYHGACLGCPVCDCESALDQGLIDTEVFAIWPRWPQTSPSSQRKDNLLAF